MFKTPEALNRERHKMLRFNSNVGYSAAANLMVIPTVAGEVLMVARDYVVVFDKTQPQALALLGVEKDRNAYVNEKGQWFGRYLPALIRSYPFSLMATPSQTPGPEGTTSFTMVIDASAPQFESSIGEKLFDDDGKPTELLEKAKQVVTSLQRDTLLTQRLVRQLADFDLLVENHIEIKKRDMAVTGFRVVDQKKLAQIAPDDLAKLRDSGALTLAYAHITSLTNLRDSPISWPSGGPVKAPVSNKLKGLFDEDGDFDFGLLN
jgi:hypothetical protein